MFLIITWGGRGGGLNYTLLNVKKKKQAYFKWIKILPDSSHKEHGFLRYNRNTSSKSLE